MPRISYSEAECRYCHAAVYVPWRPFKGPKHKFTAIICKACSQELEKTFGGAVVTRKDVYA
jgi:hypothetical protein